MFCHVAPDQSQSKSGSISFSGVSSSKTAPPNANFWLRAWLYAFQRLAINATFLRKKLCNFWAPLTRNTFRCNAESIIRYHFIMRYRIVSKQKKNWNKVTNEDLNNNCIYDMPPFHWLSKLHGIADAWLSCAPYIYKSLQSCVSCNVE